MRPRRHRLALLCGPSTSPLAAMETPVRVLDVVWNPVLVLRLLLVASSLTACVGSAPLAPTSRAPADSMAASLDFKSLAGLWQMPDAAVWMRIRDDGSAFQCRRGASGQLCVAHGRYEPPDTIAWDTCWGTEKIEYSRGILTLHTKGHAVQFVRTDRAMIAECTNAEHGS